MEKLRGCALGALSFLLSSLVASGWIWLFRWLRSACPVAFWVLDLGLLALGPVLLWAWFRLLEMWLLETWEEEDRE